MNLLWLFILAAAFMYCLGGYMVRRSAYRNGYVQGHADAILAWAKSYNDEVGNIEGDT